MDYTREELMQRHVYFRDYLEQCNDTTINYLSRLSVQESRFTVSNYLAYLVDGHSLSSIEHFFNYVNHDVFSDKYSLRPTDEEINYFNYNLTLLANATNPNRTRVSRYLYLINKLNLDCESSTVIIALTAKLLHKDYLVFLNRLIKEDNECKLIELIKCSDSAEQFRNQVEYKHLVDAINKSSDLEKYDEVNPITLDMVMSVLDRLPTSDELIEFNSVLDEFNNFYNEFGNVAYRHVLLYWYVVNYETAKVYTSMNLEEDLEHVVLEEINRILPDVCNKLIDGKLPHLYNDSMLTDLGLEIFPPFNQTELKCKLNKVRELYLKSRKR